MQKRKMKVVASKAMASWLREQMLLDGLTADSPRIADACDWESAWNVYTVYVPKEQLGYRLNPAAWDMSDYNSDTGCFRLLVVEYPPKFYAGERYLTSDMLRNIFRESDGTADGFYREFLYEVAI